MFGSVKERKAKREPFGSFGMEWLWRRASRTASPEEAERLLAAYEAYVADVTAYAQSKFETVFGFYRELEQECIQKDR